MHDFQLGCLTWTLFQGREYPSGVSIASKPCRNALMEAVAFHQTIYVMIIHVHTISTNFNLDIELII